MKLNKKSMIRAGIAMTLVLALVLFIFLIHFSYAVIEKQQYVLGEKVKIDLSEFGSYTLKIITPSNSYIKKGNDSVIMFTPEELGNYKIEVTSNSKKNTYEFSVVTEIDNQTISNSSQNIENLSENSFNNQTIDNVNETLGIQGKAEINKPFKLRKVVNGIEEEYSIDINSEEKNISRLNKEVKISATEKIDNISAYTSIDEGLKLRDKSKIKIYSKDDNKEIAFQTVDSNGDGLIDEVEWQASSNETYEIIIITKAEWLDENRTFIEDVYDKVKAKDDLWARIPENNYLRVTFEKNLTKDNDITLLPRVVSGDPKIEVYEKDNNVKIAEFNPLESDKLNKILLTNLQDSQDTFDLKVVGGDVEIDYVVDPIASFVDGTGVSPIGTTAATASNLATVTSSIPGTNLVFGAVQLLGGNPAGTKTIVAGALKLNGGTSNLNSNQFNIAVSTTSYNNNYFIMGVDQNAPSGRAYNITAYSSATPVSAEAKMIILSGLNYWNFSDGGSVPFSTTETSLATVANSFSVAGDNIVVAAVQISNGGTAQDIPAGGIKIKNGNTLLASNEYALSLGNAAPTSIQDIVILAKDTGAAANSIYNVSIVGAQSANAEAQVMVFRVANSAFVDGVSTVLPNGVATTVASIATTFAAGSNVVAIGATQLDQTGGTVRTLAAKTGCLLRESTTTRSVNEYLMSAFAAFGSAGDGIRHTLLWRTASSPANPTYDLRETASNTGLSAEGKILALQISAPDSAPPQLTTVYPSNTTYNINVSAMNYTYSDTNPNSCWFSNNSGILNSTSVVAGTNFTTLISVEGSNNWTVYCNDAYGNVNSTSVTFSKDTINPQISWGTGILSDGSNVSQTTIFANVSVTESNLKNITFYLYNSTGIYNFSYFTTSQTSWNWTSLPNGNYYYNVTVIDYAGNINYTTTKKATLDTINPQITWGTGILSDGSNVSQTSLFANVTITESNLANTTFYLYNSTGIYNFSYFPTSQTSWNWTSLPNGNYYYNVTVIDYAGNTNYTTTRKATLDTTYPQITWGTGILNDGSNVSQTTIFANVSVTESNLKNITFYLYNSTGIYNFSYFTTSQTSWNWTSLPNGNYYYNVTVIDYAGNINYTTTKKATLDTINPQITWGTGILNDGSNVSQTTIFANVTITESNLANTTFYLYNSTGIYNFSYFTTSQTSWNWTSLPNGNYYYNVTVIDYAGNTNYTTTKKATLDTINPQITWGTGILNDGSNVSQTTIFANVSVTESNLKNITFYLYNSTGIYNFSYFTTSQTSWNWTSLPNGNYYYNVTVIDYAGNTNYTTTKKATLDTINPQITWGTGILNDGSNVSQTTIFANVTITESNLANTTFYLYNSTGIYNFSYFTTSQTSWNWTSLPNGNYYYNVTVIDYAGNTNYTTTKKATLDTINPQITWGTGILNDGSNVSQTTIFANVTITESNLANTTFYLYNSTGIYNFSYFTTSQTSWNWTSLPNGNYYYNVTVIDYAGNINYTTTKKATLDTINPQISWGTGILSDGSNVSQTSLFANVTITESNLANTTFYLYNSTGIYNFSYFPTSQTSWNWTGLKDENYYYNVSVSDYAGNINTTTTRKATLDTINPQISWGTGILSDGSNVSQTSLFANVTITEANLANTTFYLYNSTGIYNFSYFTTSQTSWNWTSLPNGNYYYNITVIDYAGNTNFTSTKNLTLDTVAPQITWGTGILNDGSNVSQTSLFANVSVIGSDEKNITFNLYNSTSIVNSTTYTNQGRTINWTNLPNENYYYNVSVSDYAGNINTTTTRKATLDTINPQISWGTGILSDGSNVSQTTIFANVTITESNLANTTFYLYNSTGIYNFSYFTTSQTSWNWTSLPNGNYYYNVTVIDYAGNINYTTTKKATLDTINPQITWGTGILNDGSNVSQTTIFANVTITESNLANTTFYLYNSTGIYNFSYFPTSQTSWNWTGLKDGNYYYNVTVIDYAGNINYTTTKKATLDTTYPQITWGTGILSDGSNVSQTSLFANVTITEANLANTTFYLYNSTGIYNFSYFTTSQTSWNWTSLPNGNYYYNVTVTDYTGNLNYTTTKYLTIDTTSPLIDWGIRTSSDNANITGLTIFANVSVTELNEKNITFNLYNSTSIVNSTTYTNQGRTINWTNLPDNDYWYNVTIYDYAGNLNYTSTRKITLDNIAPLVYIDSPANITYNINAIDFNFTITESNLFNCWWTNNNSQNNNSISCLNTTYNANQGTNILQLYANDSAGNINYSSITFSVDSINPQITWGSGILSDGTIMNQTSVFANVTVTELNEANISFKIYNSTTTLNYTTFTNQQRTINWTSLPDNDYLYDVSVIDIAGNTNTTSTKTVTVDTKKPVVSFTTGTLTSGTAVESTSIFANVSVVELHFSNVTFYLYNSTDLVNSTTFYDNTRAINWTGLEHANITYLYNATAVDVVGNTNSSATYTIKLMDLTPPSLAINSPLNTTYDYNVSLSLDYDVSDDNLDSCWYKLNSGSAQNLPGCNNINFDARQGSNTIYLYANDTMGNIANINKTFVANSTAILTNYYSVQRNTASVLGSLNIPINKIDIAKSFIILDARNNSALPRDLLVTSGFLNSTMLTLQNYGVAGGGNTIVNWEIVTGPDIKVQRNVVSVAAGTPSSIVNINDVDLTKAFVIIQGRLNSGTNTQMVQGFWTGELINKTTLNITRATTGVAGEVSWQVVEWSNAYVQHNSTSSTLANVQQTLGSPVNENMSFAIFSWRMTGSTRLAYEFVEGNLVNSTTTSFSRNSGGTGTIYVSWFVVNSSILRSQRKNVALAATVFSADVPLTSPIFNTTRAFRLSSVDCAGTGVSTNGNAMVSSKIFNTTDLLVDRDLASQAADVQWQAIEIIERNPPQVNLLYPINNFNFTGYNTSQFNFSVSDENVIKNCSLYGNWTGTWRINQTIANPVNDLTVSQNFSSTNVMTDGFYNWNVECTDAFGNIGRNSTNFTFSAYLPPDMPENITINQTLNNGAGNVFLNWNSSRHSYQYRIYRTTDLSQDFSLLATSNIRNYTDTTANTTRRTFYKVAAFNPAGENISGYIYGKTVHYFKTISNVNTRNWFGLGMNSSILTSANKTLYQIPNATTVTKWDEATQTRVTCNPFSCPNPPECGDACNFNMDKGRGFEVNINSTTPVLNWSVTGLIYNYTNVSLIKNSTGSSSYGKNLIGMYMNTSLTSAYGLISSIGGADSVTDWNQDQQTSRGYLKSPFPQVPYIGTNFQIEPEKAYEIAVTGSMNWTQA